MIVPLKCDSVVRVQRNHNSVVHFFPSKKIQNESVKFHTTESQFHSATGFVAKWNHDSIVHKQHRK